MTPPEKKKRCWGEAASDELLARYHDSEWGRPLHDDRRLFEALILDGAQAGLSWRTILHKRENYRKAFDNFNVKKVVAYDEKKVRELMKNEGIVRNILKIRSAIGNAKAYLAIQKEFGSFDAYIWGYVGGKPIVHRYKKWSAVPARTKLGDAISADLKKRGMTFVGPTIIYAMLQGIGIVDDHLADCHRAGKRYFVYILECADKSLYTGITTDLARRLGEHKKGTGGRYTRAKSVKKLVYSERQPTRSAALVREAEIKKWPREKKLHLINGAKSGQQ